MPKTVLQDTKYIYYINRICQIFKMVRCGISHQSNTIRYFLYLCLFCYSVILFYIKVFEPSFLPAHWRWQILLLKYSRISHADLGDPCRDGFRPAILGVVTTYRICLNNKLRDQPIWSNLRDAIAYCLDDQLWKVLDVHFLSDNKLAVLPYKNQLSTNSKTDDTISDECVQVTLGIGEEVAGELNLRKFVPACHFYAADPLSERGVLFKGIGRYFQLAVAGKSGDKQSSNLKQKTTHNAVSFADFLKLHAKVNQVDYLFVDVDGGVEYGILHELTVDGSMEQSGKIPVCQISVKFHGPSNEFGIDDSVYNELIKRILYQSPFEPLWTSGIMGRQAGTRMTTYFFNFGSSYCVEKYVKAKLCNS